MQNSDKAPCRFCDDTGWFYGDADIGRCSCAIAGDFYGYWLHAESGCGGILHSWAQLETLRERCPLVEYVSFRAYKAAYEAGDDVEWTENEEL